MRSSLALTIVFLAACSSSNGTGTDGGTGGGTGGSAGGGAGGGTGGGTGGGGGSGGGSPALTQCLASCTTGCCLADGSCVANGSDAQCGAVQTACQVCGAGTACVNNACASTACGPATCPGGCCQADGGCASGAWNACGADGGACTACANADSCIDGTCKPVKKVFVTSLRSSGGFGGVTAADGFCGDLAADAGLGGTWVAFVADGTTPEPSNRLGDVGPWYLHRSGTKIFQAKSNVANADKPLAAINSDEFGTPFATSNRTVWVGDSNGTCSQWTSNSASASGRAGNAKDTQTWRNWIAADCDQLASFYCFEN